LTSLPSSFKRPALDVTNASQLNNFFNAFYSPSYTLDRDAALIINGCATPNTDRNTFSDNQPGICIIDSNWKTTATACPYVVLPNSTDTNTINTTFINK
jgi:hypothetical protein